MPRFGIRAQDQARDPRSIPELRAVGPFLDQRWLDMVEPAAPVVPADEDDRVAPQAALDDGIHLVGSPFLAGLDRSEEHTSELQSRFDLVCRLLLEKKK